MKCDPFLDGKLFGVYRGIVLKHLPHGRCKIYIPAAYSEEYADKPDMLPSAEQAAPLFAGVNKGNGVFSYPNIGAIVLCMFYNGDANLPLYFAATLGGENAFGQYSIIKKDLKEENGNEINSTEEESRRHLITSGKTHIEWFENGKLSAIVEDPIRTICSVDFDSWEKGNDNISADDKYQSKLSNDNVWKIRDNKLSNIDCQLVLDNNGKTNGKLSTSTHYFYIENNTDKDTGVHTDGKLSIDNWNVMSNDGKIHLGTLSTANIKIDSRDESLKLDTTVHNIYELEVPGRSNSSVKNKTELTSHDLKNDITEKSKVVGYSNFYFDFKNNYGLTGYCHLTSDSTTNMLTTSLTSKLSNSFQFDEDGAFWLSSKQHVNVLSIGEFIDPADNEKKGVHSHYDRKLSAILSSNDGDSAFETSCLSTVDHLTGDAKLSVGNQLLMHKTAKITLNSTINAKYKGNGTKTADNKSKAILDGNTGAYNRVAQWKYNDSEPDLDIKNRYALDILNHYDASLQETITSKKKEGGGKVVDFNFNKEINAQTSIFSILIDDKIAKNQYSSNVNCMNGSVDIHIMNNNTGNKCIITFDSQGKMTVFTTDKLDIQTKNAVTITTPTTTINGETIINGATTINNTLHVTSQTTVDADAIIGGKSFLGHIHGNGNMGSPTSPPI